MVPVYFNNKQLFLLNVADTTVHSVKEQFEKITNIPATDVYSLQNGKVVPDNFILREYGKIELVPKLLGGKGGFGSMLRAIGAQIEKTTNREACRDLSGRRLRDINEEKRLKNWINGQADREQEAVERRQKKIERLCAEPKFEFEDKDYDRERSDLTDKVADSVEAGFASVASSSTSGVSQKRKIPAKNEKPKKRKLWIDADEDDISSSLDSDSEDGAAVTKSTVVSSPITNQNSVQSSSENSTSSSEEAATEAPLLPDNTQQSVATV